MVPVTSEGVRSVAAQIAEFAEDVRREWRWLSPEAGFAVWVAHQAQIPPVMPAADVIDPRWNEAPFLAAVGYLLAAGGLDGEHQQHWESGMREVARRDALPADRNSFMYRPLELLGLAVATTNLGRDHDLYQWLHAQIARGGKDLIPSPDPWTTALNQWTARIMQTEVDGVPGHQDSLWPMAIAVLDGDGSDSAEAFLRRAATEGVAHGDVAQSALLWAALRLAVASTLGAAALTRHGTTVDLVEQLCRRFPAFVAQLSHRHDGRPTLQINDEYDVQDALHAALRLHFTDVRDEEPAPSHAATTTRLDLLLKIEGIVIETKMTRTGLTHKKLIEEIAIDKERYQSHPDCKQVVFFVYDPGGLLKNPVALERDASGMIGQVPCRVIVAPRDHGAESFS